MRDPWEDVAVVLFFVVGVVVVVCAVALGAAIQVGLL